MWLRERWLFSWQSRYQLYLGKLLSAIICVHHVCTRGRDGLCVRAPSHCDIYVTRLSIHSNAGSVRPSCCLSFCLFLSTGAEIPSTAPEMSLRTLSAHVLSHCNPVTSAAPKHTRTTHMRPSWLPFASVPNSRSYSQSAFGKSRRGRKIELRKG